MKCPKCSSQNQNGNFCSNCANPLREKCSECGEMEPIGRLVCETRIGKIRTGIIAAVPKPIERLLDVGLVLMTSSIIWAFGSILVFHVLRTSHPPRLMPLSITFIPFIFLWSLGGAILYLADRLRQKAWNKFLALHPDYKELLCKQEVWEKAQREEAKK